jgi:hypothetical protein
MLTLAVKPAGPDPALLLTRIADNGGSTKAGMQMTKSERFRTWISLKLVMSFLGKIVEIIALVSYKPLILSPA